MAGADSYSILHDQQLFVGSDPIAPPSVLANDNDPVGNPLIAILDQGPTHGHFEQFNSDGSFRYDPNPSFTGTDSFTYWASNGVDQSDPTTVTITVTVQTPTAVTDTFSLVQNYPLLHANILANDIDPGDDLQPVIVSQPQHGSVVVNDDGTVTYTPNSQYLGQDSFSYEASNGILTSTPATVMLNVMNLHPYANNDTLFVLHDQQLTGANVLTNDMVPTSNALQPILVGTPQHGTATVQDDGTINYQPNAGFVGMDSFTYKLNDGVADSNTATVMINVTNMAPMANSANYSLLQNRPFVLDKLATVSIDPDGDTLTPVIVQGPAHGQITDLGGGIFQYAPNSAYVGMDSFTYKVNDGISDSNVATVTLNVTNQHPQTNNDFLTVTHDQQLASGNVLANDFIPISTPLLPIIVAQPQHGTAFVQADGTINYQPNAGFVGTDTLTYKLNDGVADSNTTTVTINVTNMAPVLGGNWGPPPGGPGNNPPAPLVAYNVLKNQSYSLAQLLQFGSDADGDALHVVIQQAPSHGQVTFQSDGTPLYTPNTGYTGIDSLTVTVNDGFSNSNIATVNLNVVDTGLVANDSYITVDSSPTFYIVPGELLANAKGLPGSALQISQVSNAQHGIVSQDQQGEIVYTANLGYSGFDQFMCTIGDGAGRTATANVFLRVLAQAPGQAPQPQLDELSLQRWGAWTQGTDILRLDRVNQLLAQNDLPRNEAAALVTLKFNVLQNGGNQNQPGEFGSGPGNVFGDFDRAQGLERRSIERFAQMRNGSFGQTLQQRAELLQTIFVNRSATAATLLTQMWPNAPQGGADAQRAFNIQQANGIQQGIIGDCAFVSAMTSFVRKGGLLEQAGIEQLPHRFREDQRGFLFVPQVRYYNSDTNNWGWYDVPGLQTPTIGQRLQFGNGAGGFAWFSVFEVGYLRLRFLQDFTAGTGPIVSNFYYESIAGGEPMVDAIRRVTGTAGSGWHPIANLSNADLVRNLTQPQNNRKVITADTVANIPTNIQAQFGYIPNHAYEVVGLIQGNTFVELQNPWNNSNVPLWRRIEVPLAVFRTFFAEFATESFVAAP